MIALQVAVGMLALGFFVAARLEHRALVSLERTVSRSEHLRSNRDRGDA